MDKKHQKDIIEQSFETDPHILFLHKKSEKLGTAIYLITNLIKDEDQVKWQLRKRSLDLLSDTIFLYHVGISNKGHLKKITSTLSEITSLFEIASLAGLVSEMNSNILRKELLSFMEMLSAKSHEGQDEKDNLILSEEFFTAEYPKQSSAQPKEDHKKTMGIDRLTLASSVSAQDQGHNKRQIKNSTEMSQSSLKDKNQMKSEDRKIIILNLLKTLKSIGVNDVVNLVSNCSEKTIQRELLAMVKEGVLKKEGERRWSRYTLV